MNALIRLAVSWASLVLCCSPAAIQHLQAAPSDLQEQARRAFETGAFSRAAFLWEQALNQSRRDGNVHAEVTTSVSLAGAYHALGLHRRAVRILEEALPRAQADPPLLNLVQRKLGGALVLTRESSRATALLHEALENAQTAGDLTAQAEVLNDMGNLHVTQRLESAALSLYLASLEFARQVDNPLLTVQALCNAAASAVRAGDLSAADELNAQALGEIDYLNPSHAKAFFWLTAGQTDAQLQSLRGGSQGLLRAQNAFRLSLELSETLGDRSIETYALGYLAQLYERDGQDDSALTLAQRAAFVAQQYQMPEALYRWEWLIGRILNQQGGMDSAILAYRRAVQGISPIRNDVALGYGNASVQRSFRESEGPLFLELADLLLQKAGATPDPQDHQKLLLEARDTMEHLKAVELEDYFCDDCVDVQRATTRAIEAVDTGTAVVYLIPLPSRTEILIGLTSGLRRYTMDVGADLLTAQVHQLRRNLETRTTFAYLEQAQLVYDWLIRPIHPLLTENQIHTLVFVPDGALRTIPFAALHDGQRFLIQEYAVAVAPGLSLVEPKSLERGKARLLLNGLSESVQNFPPLTFVAKELAALQPLFPSQMLFNETFTIGELSRKLTEEQYSIIHIASHGQFDRDVRKTFLLTYDGKLTLNDLEALIRPSQYRGRPLELLVLSACQTAAGDDRAALGLAGVAVKAGARSALATLWFVNDQSTSALVEEVYLQLQKSPSVSKARALQTAQVALLSDRRYRHPCYWSPYLIIGNWL